MFLHNNTRWCSFFFQTQYYSSIFWDAKIIYPFISTINQIEFINIKIKLRTNIYFSFKTILLTSIIWYFSLVNKRAWMTIPCWIVGTWTCNLCAGGWLPYTCTQSRPCLLVLYFLMSRNKLSSSRIAMSAASSTEQLLIVAARFRDRQ